jgi:ribosomal subunit interface protein
MQYSLTTRNIEASDWDRQQLEKKIERLGKHLLPPFQIDIHVSHSRHHTNGEVVECTINIKQQSADFYTKRSNSSFQDALDDALDAMGQELAKAHDKRKNHRDGLEGE